MKAFSRLKRLWAVVKGHAGNGYLQGRAAQIAGTALIADGLIGLENPLDGKKSRLGIFGALVFFGAGVFFLIMISLALKTSQPYENGEVTTGVVVEIIRSEEVCYVEVEYPVNTATYRARSSFGSSTLCSSMGQPLDVSYVPENPAGGRVIPSGSESALTAMFVVIPIIFIVVGAGTFLIRLATLAGGIYLFFWGRKRANSNPEVPLGSIKDELVAAWGATGERTAPLISIGGPSSASSAGSVIGSLFGQDSDTEARPAGPPPGMYDDPDGQGQRWWDGNRWTEHSQDDVPGSDASQSHGTVEQRPVVPEQQATLPAAPSGTPSGWYPDPDGQGTRWWDGNRWTDRTEG